MTLSIDRLTLRLSGVTEPDARRLAQLVADRLGAVDTLDHGFTADRLHVGIVAVPGESLDQLSNRIASELLIAIARAS